MSTKCTVALGEGWHLWTDCFEDDVHLYLEVRGKPVVEGVHSAGKASITLRITGEMLSLFDPRLQEAAKNAALKVKDMDEELMKVSL